MKFPYIFIIFKFVVLCIVYDLIHAEEPEIDPNGCNTSLKKNFEDRCDYAYEKVDNDAHLIKDDRERSEVVCCALDDYEKCILRAHDKANCTADKISIRENIKAARLFHTVIANVDCSRFRVQCDHNNAATPDEESELEIDANGCNINLRKHFEDRCDEAFEKVQNETHLIKDDRERSDAVCCALEDFEKCSRRSYAQANCTADETSIRENLRETRLFLIVTANIDCLRSRRQCAHNNAAIPGQVYYALVSISILAQMYLQWTY